MCSITDFIRISGLLPALILLLASCTADQPQSPATQIKGQQSLRFGVPAHSGVVSRVADSGVSSTFEDGDKVGCVIAFRNSDNDYDFQATTQWHYSASTGMLVLDEIYKTAGTECSRHVPTADDVICRFPDTKVNDGYVQLNADGREYCFFFYYPFINSDRLMEDFISYVNNKDPYKLNAPFSGYRMEQTPNWTISSTQNKQEMIVIGMPDATTSYFYDTEYTDGTYRVHPHFNWKQFPCFASIAQGSTKQLNNSNFMWVSYVMDQKDPSRPVTKEDKDTHYTVNLQFRKKFAAIDLVIDDPEISTADGDIYYRNTPEDDNGTYSNYIRIGRKFDISTGQFSDYPQLFQERQFGQSGYSNKTEWPCIRASHLCDSYEDNDYKGGYNKIRPCPLGGGVYRMVLPPQDNFKCELHFRKNGVEHAIDLYSKLPELRENTLYTIRLTSAGDWNIIITDWEDGSNMLIEEDK